MTENTHRPPPPPLKLALTIQYDHKVSWLPYAHGGRVFIGTPEGVRAVDEETGELRWQSTQDGFPLSAHDEVLFVRRLTEDYRFLCFDVLDATSGGFLRTVLQWESLSKELLLGPLLLCATSEPEQAVCAVGLDDGAERWRWPVGDDTGVQCRLGADSDSVYACLEDGPVVALDLGTGRERWRHSVANLTWTQGSVRRKGQARGTPTAIGDTVIVDAYGGRIVGLSRGNGKRLWVHECGGEIADSVAYGGRYHSLGVSGKLVTIDPVNGGALSTVNLDRGVPRPKVQVGPPAKPLLVSDTHVYTGSEEGHVLAFASPSGQYVWSLRPKGAASTAHDAGRFAVAGRRLYYSDMSLRLYGLEEDRSAPPARRRRLS